jgi:hypothetical protein
MKMFANCVIDRPEFIKHDAQNEQIMFNAGVSLTKTEMKT